MAHSMYNSRWPFSFADLCLSDSLRTHLYSHCRKSINVPELMKLMSQYCARWQTLNSYSYTDRPGHVLPLLATSVLSLAVDNDL